jgi:hypothetical protein
MKNGKWSPIRDGIIDKIPSNRSASIGDFALIVTQLYKRETPTSVALLAKRLCWSREKVSIYLEKVGLKIQYLGERKSPTGGILKPIPREELNPENEGIWVVLQRGHS